MEASLQSILANSEMAYHYWSSVEYKTVGQSRHAVTVRVRERERERKRERERERA
jgi:hypothetical protein